MMALHASVEHLIDSWIELHSTLIFISLVISFFNEKLNDDDFLLSLSSHLQH